MSKLPILTGWHDIHAALKRCGDIFKPNNLLVSWFKPDRSESFFSRSFLSTSIFQSRYLRSNVENLVRLPASQCSRPSSVAVINLLMWRRCFWNGWKKSECFVFLWDEQNRWELLSLSRLNTVHRRHVTYVVVLEITKFWTFPISDGVYRSGRRRVHFNPLAGGFHAN